MINKFRAFREEVGMTLPFSLGNLQDREQFDFVDGTYLSWNEFGLEHEDTVLMQYSGILDSNKIEICEGDIVSVQVDYFDYEFRQPSKLHNYELNIVNIQISIIEGCFVLDSDYIPDDGKMLWLWDNLTIVGNIYENPTIVLSNLS